MDTFFTLVIYFVLFVIAAKKYHSGKLKSYYGWMALTLFLLATEFIPSPNQMIVVEICSFD